MTDHEDNTDNDDNTHHHHHQQQNRHNHPHSQHNRSNNHSSPPSPRQHHRRRNDQQQEHSPPPPPSNHINSNYNTNNVGHTIHDSLRAMGPWYYQTSANKMPKPTSSSSTMHTLTSGALGHNKPTKPYQSTLRTTNPPPAAHFPLAPAELQAPPAFSIDFSYMEYPLPLTLRTTHPLPTSHWHQQNCKALPAFSINFSWKFPLPPTLNSPSPINCPLPIGTNRIASPTSIQHQFCMEYPPPSTLRTTHPPTTAHFPLAPTELQALPAFSTDLCMNYPPHQHVEYPHSNPRPPHQPRHQQHILTITLMKPPNNHHSTPSPITHHDVANNELDK